MKPICHWLPQRFGTHFQCFLRGQWLPVRTGKSLFTGMRFSTFLDRLKSLAALSEDTKDVVATQRVYGHNNQRYQKQQQLEERAHRFSNEEGYIKRDRSRFTETSQSSTTNGFWERYSASWALYKDTGAQEDRPNRRDP